MLVFCGQERCILDGNGRLKLPQRFVDDFIARCGGEVVLHGLAEGALALYPEDVYAEMRRHEQSILEKAASSFVIRQSMRRFGALAAPDTITRQGRITLPGLFREYADLEPGCELCVIGVEIGVEIWSVARYRAEFEAIRSHLATKRERELAADLLVLPHEGGAQ